MTGTSNPAAADPVAGDVRDTWWGRRFGGLPSRFWLLFAGIGTARLGFVAVPFLSYWLVVDRGLTPGDAGLVMTAFGAGWALSMPLGGWLADQLGRRAVIVASALGSAGAYLGIAAIHPLTWLLAVALLVGATFDLYRPALQAAMTDAVPVQSRTRALGLLYLSMNASRMVACAAGGLVANAGDFAILFAANAAVNVVFAAVLWRAVPVNVPPQPTGGRGALRTAIADRRLLAFTAATLAFYTIHTQSMVALPVALAHAGATPLGYGLLLALDPLIVVVCQISAQAILNRAPALVTCAVGVAAVGAGLALAGLVSGLAWIASTWPIWVIGEMAFLTAAPGVVAALAPDHARGAYFGLWGASQGVAAVLAPLIAAAAATVGRTDLVWLGGAVTGLCTAAALLRMRRRLPTEHPVPGLELDTAANPARFAGGEAHIGRSTSSTAAPTQKAHSRR
nr:MFS transporter [Hamadaea tsunoensis]